MSGDHNEHQKCAHEIDQKACEWCGHCCKTDLARVGEVGVWGEWAGLTGDEARKFYEKYTDRKELIYAIDKFLEAKNNA